MGPKHDTPNYINFCPPGKPGIRFPLKNTHVDPANVEARRAHIVAFMKHMEVYTDDEDWARMKAGVVEQLCSMLRKRGAKRVSHTFFEYGVDVGMWNKLLGHLEPAPKWPWTRIYMPKPRDLEEGECESKVYAEWLAKTEADEFLDRLAEKLAKRD
ncbi:hypothetical protein FDECE_13554 [Fusarium decemcellulare]|nr:hypothetical protein FDECE_13554 [Fusarium decemcellulare]